MGLFSWLQNRLPSRKIEWEDTIDKEVIELPKRTQINVSTKIKKMRPLAQVKKSWARSKLLLTFSRYISGGYESGIKRRQALQVCLHELMHIALWDDITITHSTDKSSLLYSMVDGNTIIPNEWDLTVMIEAAGRIDEILIWSDGIDVAIIREPLEKAIALWNHWLDKELFRIV